MKQGPDGSWNEEYGDVVLGPGDITMKAKCAVIKNSTTVLLGTKLKNRKLIWTINTNNIAGI